MQFNEGSFYHIYNRGNNKEKIFFSQENYRYFLDKVNKYVYPACDILAWTLMPNHFHFLIHANQETCKLVKHSPIKINALTEGIRLLLSSYSKAIQKQQGNTGNLFQQKTKSKCIDDYTTIAFHYIHQNALKGSLIEKLEDWEFSSFNEYLNTSSRKLCNVNLAYQYLNINQSDFLIDSYKVIRDDIAKDFFY